MVKPTIAIGVGKAGCRMVTELSQVAEREGCSDQFEFITIDTNEDDLYDYRPQDEGNPFPLEEPGQEFFKKTHRREYSYLREEFRLPQGQGTTRQRALSRYHIDHTDNFENLRGFLEENIDTFVDERVSAIDDEEVADVNIWLLNSLGGGTGSGSFPLVAAMLKNITDSLDYDFFRGGLGSLPRLDGLEDRIAVPAGNGDFYTNAYTALRELRELINYENKPDRYPIHFDLEGEHPNVPASSLELGESPFDMYWLLGFDESEDGRSYRQQMNAVAANGIFFHAAMDSPENFPDDDDVGEHTLYALDASEIRVPHDKARRFVELQQELRDLETTIEDLKREIEARESDIGFLNELRKLDLDYRELPTEADHVDTEMLRECRNMANDFDPHGVTDRAVNLDEHIDTLLRRAEDRIQDGPFDKRVVISQVYCRQLYTLLDELIAEHRFKETVDEAWEEHEEELREEFPYLEDDEPIDKWENGLEEFLFEKGRELKQEAEDVTLNRIRKRRLLNEVDRLGKQVNKLQEYYEEYELLRDLRTEAESRVSAARNTLLETKQDIERTVEDLREERRQQESNLENKRGKRQRKRESLGREHVIGGGYTLPMHDISNLTDEIIANSDSIADYIDNGKLERETLARTMRSCLQNIDDPVHDVARDDSVITQSVLGIMTNEENISGPAGNLLSLSVPGKMDIQNQISTEFDYYDEDENLVELRDGFSIWFVGFYTNLAFVNTSEFGTIHEYYDDPTRSVEELLGEGYTDEDVTTSFAYPELFQDDEEIQSAFGQ